LLKSIQERYIELLKVNYNKTNDATLYPGIPEILERLAAEESIHLALLTGNIEEGARIKLSPFDLNKIFPVGAFGNDGFARTDLSHIAVNRAEDYYGISFDSKNIVVIGDTADDVECGKVINARSIAISRRPSTLDTLKASNPDHLFFGTEKVDQFIKAVFN
jgi:phosphoglycolate phosphatase-like HAD superfamily hydrolase